ncbi:MAG: acyloxyacyl hydrolase [Bacteroidetes bacterium]|nr:acyloxyacyl hydrolase [Bacteroidota bacterium]
MNKNRLQLLCLLFLVMPITVLNAQDDSVISNKRLQYPPGLINGNFGVSIGNLHYNFNEQQLEPGFSVASVHVPPIGVRVNLMGFRFNKNLSANIHYLRPVGWVEYKNVNGDNTTHTVWMNIVGLTLQDQIPFTDRMSWYGEAGLGIVTRKGFKVNNQWAVKNTSFATTFLETGLRYRVNQKWDLIAGVSYTPKNKNEKQPASYFYSAGFTYNMRPLAKEKIDEKKKAGYKFPKNTIQLGVSTNGLGYGVNNFASEKSPIPFFWGGDVEVRSGVAIHYHRNIFHAKKVFSFDWGVSAGVWQTRKQRENFFTLSVFPVLRFNVVHTKKADGYFFYSIAGPTFISKNILDNELTGRHFTFQDILGIGTFIGKNRKVNAEINIGHFSNGNIYPYNGGVKLPLTFCLGYTFD